MGKESGLINTPSRRAEIHPRRLSPQPLSAAARGDSSRRAGAALRICPWCETSFLEGRRDKVFCSTRCRQASWRFGVKPSRCDRVATAPLRIAYADPPYPGKASLYPGGREVDHASLVHELRKYDGWALSTSQAALRDVLPSCPPGIRIAVWVRSCRATRSRRPLNAWEPLIFYQARPLSTSVVQDLHDVLEYRGRYRAYPGAMVGMKPPQFAVWMFRLLGASPIDAFHDIYPGSGAVSRAWKRFAEGGR